MRDRPTILHRYAIAHLIEHIVQMVQQLVILANCRILHYA